MTSYYEYLHSLRVRPDDLVEVLPDGTQLPEVLDLSPGAPRRGGTHLCLICKHSPYEPMNRHTSNGCGCCEARRDRHVDPETTDAAREANHRLAHNLPGGSYVVHPR